MKRKTKDYRHYITDKILHESYRQLKVWGEQNHDQMIWLGILAEEFGEVSKEVNEFHFRKGDVQKIETELIQTAAVCVSMLDSLFRNGKAEKVRRSSRTSETGIL